MLLAHLVPGYFAATRSQTNWPATWSRSRRALLWAAALGSTAAPDLDVVYNSLFRGFINHSLLWTHSLFLYLSFGLIWLILRSKGASLYLRTLVGLVTVSGLSHLVLDVLSHGTVLFYPLSMVFVGAAPARVVQGGFWAYITDPIFLLEPCLLALAAVHWIRSQHLPVWLERISLTAAAGGLLLFAALFLALLPQLQRAVPH